MRPVICDELERQGIVLYLEGPSLLYRAPRGKMTSSLRSELKRFKPDLLMYMKAKAEQHHPAANMVIKAFDGELLGQSMDGDEMPATLFLECQATNFHGAIINAPDKGELYAICRRLDAAYKAGDLDDRSMDYLTRAITDRANQLEAADDIAP